MWNLLYVIIRLKHTNMNQYNKNILLHSSILLGCIIPFGNILGPLLFRTDNPDLQNNRKFILRFQVLLASLFFVTSVFIWLHQIQLLASNMNINNLGLKIWVAMYFLFVFFYPIFSIVFILLKKSQYLLCYPKIGR